MYVYIPPYPQDILSKTSRGCLKPWTVPNPLCVFSCMSTPVIKFRSSVRHSKNIRIGSIAVLCSGAIMM